MIVYLVLVTLTCCSYITCWVEKPRLAAEQEEKRSVSEKQQVFHKVWIKALWILQKTSLCFMSELHCYEYVQVLHFLFQLAQIKRCKKKKKFKCVRKKRRNASSAARVTHLSAPRRSASLPAQKVSLPPRWRLLSRHPQQRASSCCQQRQRERAQIQKKTKLKKFWYLIKSVSTLYKNNWSFERTQRNNSSGVFQRNQLTRSKDCRWKMYVIMWHHPMVSGLHTSLCTFLCLFVVQVLFKHKVFIYIKKTWRCSCSAPFTQSAFESKEWKLSVILSEHCCRPGCDISPPLFLS